MMNDDLWLDSLWLIDKRSTEGGHSLTMQGAFVPQIPNQMIRRFTKPGDLVVDLFLGSATTAREALNLGRRCLGIDINENAIVRASAEFVDAIENGHARFYRADAAKPELNLILQEKAPLVILHPPYWDIIKFSDHPSDLSNHKDYIFFEKAMATVMYNAYQICKDGGRVVLVMGDKYTKGEWIPMGFHCMQLLQRYFKLKGIIVKNMANNEAKGKNENLWKYRAEKHGFYLFKHEYIFVGQRM